MGARAHRAYRHPRKEPAMHAADLTRSPRLQRVAELLADGREHTTMEIVQAAQVCAVNSIVAELRANGLHILCRRVGDAWVYWQPAEEVLL
jgi:hypothetical protein